MLFCTCGLAVSTPELVSVMFDPKTGIGTGFFGTGFWVVEFFLHFYLLFGIFMGWGLFRVRLWAAICSLIWAVVLMLYALSFILLVGSGYGVTSYRLSCIEVSFAVFTLSIAGYILTSRPNEAKS